MRAHLVAILAQPKWGEILSEYPRREYKNINDSELEVMVNKTHPRACVIKVSLKSNSYNFNDFKQIQYPHYRALPQILSLINPSEDYSKAVLNFSPDEFTSFDFLMGDGPNSSSFGTYQFNSNKNSIRLFTVQAGTKRTSSIYEVEDEKETCPCEQSLTIQMSDEISISDFGR